MASALAVQGLQQLHAQQAILRRVCTHRVLSQHRQTHLFELDCPWIFFGLESMDPWNVGALHFACAEQHDSGVQSHKPMSAKSLS